MTEEQWLQLDWIARNASEDPPHPSLFVWLRRAGAHPYRLPVAEGDEAPAIRFYLNPTAENRGRPYNLTPGWYEVTPDGDWDESTEPATAENIDDAISLAYRLANETGERHAVLDFCDDPDAFPSDQLLPFLIVPGDRASLWLCEPEWVAGPEEEEVDA
jgi:hypothetical protein